MHILMTGGTGLIGTATCAALYAAGHKLTILTRRARPATTEATYITSLGECAETVDVVINLAGAGLADRRWSSAYKRQIVSSRVDLTRELVVWMSELEQPPKRLISASAIGYYGAADEQTFSESAGVGTGFSAALCQSWEEEAGRAAEYGTQVSLLRFGVVLAKEGGALGKMTQSFRLGVETWLGSGEQWLSWIHLEDAVRVIQHVLALECPAGVYNTVAPQPARHRELAHEAGRQSRTWLKLGVPALAARLMAGEMAEELLLSGQRVLPSQLLEDGFQFHYPSLKEALGDAMPSVA
ncbi:MAG: TIGR01777 family oxidoreductase [Luminiphilus sp.]